ncbi:MAG: hypothetical protein EZS28_005388 [Streblomastix strix]|uniref:Wntless-like transmembrane domain-containing protein n=1 Tax=Streblomastix strix TaxID=222440 RepID=A0A5J4WVT8_9EUKA|nr:MAG: hypothetical protein EZS28_005388 [Streblomastix strix]
MAEVEEPRRSKKIIETQLLETRLFQIPGLVVSLIAFFVVIGIGCGICAALPVSTSSESFDTWQCDEEPHLFDKTRCSGVDMRKIEEPFVIQTTDVRGDYRFTAFRLSPHSILATVGFNFRINFLFNVTNNKNNKTEYFNETKMVFCTEAGRQCQPVNIFSGPAGNYSISLLHLDTKTIEQKWLFFFAIAIFFFDDALIYLLQVELETFALAVLDTLFQSAFLAFAMSFVLCILGGLITRKTTFVWFVIPRLLLSGIFFVFDVAVGMSRLSDHRIDVLLGDRYTVIRCYVVSRQHARAIEGRYRVYVIFIVVAVALFISLLLVAASQPRNVRNYLNTVSHTMVGVFTWMMLLWMSPTKLSRQTRTSITGAMRPKENQTSVSAIFEEEDARNTRSLIINSEI